MDWLLHKYIGIVSTRLDKFKRKSPNLYNFRCPICGDSEYNKNKARGYIFQQQGKLIYHCHNCGASMSVLKFIETIDLNLYNELRLEQLRENKTPEQIDYEQFVER